jgi:hypothetical protein
MAKTKWCPGCERRRRTSSFYKNRRRADGLQSSCKDCSKARRERYWRNGENKDQTKRRARERRREIAKAIYEMLENTGCLECDERNPVLLEFDHVRGEKTMTVSRMISNSYGIERIKREIEKCVVRCVRCHRLKTARERGWYRWLEN